MRVLFISGAFPPVQAGESAHTLYLCHNLARRGVDVHVLTGTEHAGLRDASFTAHAVMRGWSWSDLPRLVGVMRRVAPDAVLLMYTRWVYNEHPMITFAPTVARRSMRRVPFVTQFESLSAGTLRHPLASARMLNQAARLWAGGEGVDHAYGTLLRDSDHIIVLTNQYRDALARRSPDVSKKSLLVPPPPILRMPAGDERALRRRGREMLGVGPQETLLAYYGYIYSRKGVDTLLQAFQHACAHHDNLRLVLIGGFLSDPVHAAYGREMRRMPETLGVADRVLWTGDCPADSDEASLYLRAADMCVLPFDDGVVLNRSSFAAAAAHGLPTITTRGDCLEPPFVDRKNVLLCPPGDPRALAAAIDVLIKDPDLRHQLRRGVLQLAGEWFAWDRAIDRTLSAFEIAV